MLTTQFKVNKFIINPMSFHQQIVQLCKAILFFQNEVGLLKDQLFNIPILTKQLVWNHIVGASSKATALQIYSFFAKHGLQFKEGDTELLIWQYSSNKDNTLSIDDLWQIFKPLTTKYIDQIMAVRQRKISLPKCYEAHYKISDSLTLIMSETLAFLRKSQKMKWNIVKAEPEPFSIQPLDAPHLQIVINKKQPLMILKEVELVFKHILRNQAVCVKNFQQYFIPFNYKSASLNPNFTRQEELVNQLLGIQLIKYHAQNVDFIKHKEIKKPLKIIQYSNDKSLIKELIVYFFIIFLQQFQIIIARPMGAIISKCCQQSETTTIIQSAPRPTKKKPNIVHQQQQSIKTKQQIPQRPKSIPQVQQQQFFEIQSFIEEREKSNLQPPKLTFDDFEINGKLGEGSFGVVLQVQLKQQRDKNINYAMKRIGRDKMKNRKIVSSVHLQRNILASASHSFITSLKYAFADKHSLYLVMESAGGGDVSTLINHPQRQQAFRAIRTKGVQFITACTILALQYLHSHNIIYRDLKTQNILIFSDGYVKLSDFGLAKIVNSEDELSKTHAGTALYTAPQVVLKSGYKKSVDLWALGVLIYELATGETPFKLEDVSTKLRFKRVCQQEQKLRKWRGHQLDSDLKDLVGRLLKFNPQDRLGVKDMQQIKNHTYFKGFNWQHLVEKSMQSPLLSIIQSYPTKIQSFQNKRVGQQNFSDEYDSEESWDFNYNLH